MVFWQSVGVHAGIGVCDDIGCKVTPDLFTRAWRDETGGSGFLLPEVR